MSLPDDYEIITTTSTDATVKVYVPWTFDGVDELNVWYQNTITGIVYYLGNGDFIVTTDEDGGGVFVLIENTQGAEAINISIARQTPKTQTYSLNEAEALNPTALIEALDKAIKLLQEVALGYDDQNITSVNPFVHPDKVTRADKIMSFDSNGDPQYATLDDALQDPITWASEWAKKAEDVLVSVAAGGDGATDYSSLHHAAKSAASAAAALVAQGAAEDAQTAAETAETNAETAQTAAELAQTNSETAQTAAELAETNAETARDKAQDWAEEDEDVEVETGEYSAKHWAKKAEASFGGILPSNKTDMTDSDYTMLIGDVGKRIFLPSSATEDRTLTVDVSLLTDFLETVSINNESDYILMIVVSNTGTMTFNNTSIDRFISKADGILTLNGDSATNANIVAGG